MSVSTGTLYRGAPRPYLSRRVPHGKVQIGVRRRVARGELRCWVDGDVVNVAVYDGAKVVGSVLSHHGATAAERRDGAVLDTALFACEDHYVLHSPWHDGAEMVLLWTVEALCASGQPIDIDVTTVPRSTE